MKIFLALVFIWSLFACGISPGEAQYDETNPEIILRPKVEYKAEGLEDPFSDPLIVRDDAQKPQREERLPNFIVQGLIWGGNFPQAIINNKVLRVGDNLEGAQIVSIDKEGITLLFNQAQYRLKAPGKAQSLPNP